MKNFWEKLNKPFFVLAPMADVTDAAFRRLIAKYAKPDVMYTEFVSADGLISAGKKNLVKDLVYDKSERPIVGQIFTSKVENMEKGARLIQDLGFDGVDINMGCPDKSIEKQGCGSALIKNPKLAQELIVAAKKGAPKIPISVKTRIGYNKNELDEWLPVLLEAEPAAVILHLRTRKEMSKVPANWDVAKDVVAIRDKMKSKTLIIGNGDVASLKEAKQKAKDTDLDGIMIGRGIFGNPWLFSDHKPTKEEKLTALIEHSKLFEELVSHKRFHIMKKHFKAYVTGWLGAKELRMKLMEAENSNQVESTIKDYLVDQ